MRSGVAAWTLLFAACGGSGSTGLIHPEGVLLRQVRESGECVDAGEVTYCPALAAADPLPGIPGPGEPPVAGGPVVLFVFDTGGLEGLTCVTATRTAPGDWHLGTSDVAGSETAPNSFAVVVSSEALTDGGSVEAALLCFDTAPRALPSVVGELADANPDLVFVTPAL